MVYYESGNPHSCHFCRANLKEKLYDEQCQSYEAAIEKYAKGHEEGLDTMRESQEHTGASVKEILRWYRLTRILHLGKH